MASLSLKHVDKIYPGGIRAVGDFSLDIDDKEFIVIVGPSGCGKSTLLRIIAGLDEISHGELYIDGKLSNDVEPKYRDMAMVFQNYALYSHLTVYENMAFGLKIRHVDPEIIDKKVRNAASILGIEHLLNRRPASLSGGQCQRVALGRAIVREPRVFLLDEPLSNVDAKTRVQMRTEITKIHHDLATTFVYVTHDQTEAMTMGTRIVVMKDGCIQQVDTPTALYDNPANLFVATFLGSPQMNIFKVRLVEERGEVYALIGERNKILVPGSCVKRIYDRNVIGKEVLLGIRPEDVHYEQSLVEANPKSVIDATVDVVENLGNETIVYLNVDGKDDYVVARVNARYSFTSGERVRFYLAMEHVHLFDIDTEASLTRVPEYNMIQAQTAVSEGTLAVMFGDTIFYLPKDIMTRFTGCSSINGGVTLGIPPSALKSTGNAGDICIDGVAEFGSLYTDYRALYITVPGIKGYVIAFRPAESAFSGGEHVKLYFDPACVQLFDGDGKRIIAAADVGGNESTATISVTRGRTKYKLTAKNGKSVTLKARGEHGKSVQNAKVHIDPKGVSVSTGEKNGMTLVGTITRIDAYGNGATVWADVKGIDGEFVADIVGFSGYYVGDKIKFVISPDAIKLGAATSAADVVSSNYAASEGEVRIKEYMSARKKAKSVEKHSVAKRGAKSPVKDEVKEQSTVTEVQPEAAEAHEPPQTDRTEAPEQKPEQPKRASRVKRPTARRK